MRRQIKTAAAQFFFDSQHATMEEMPFLHGKVGHTAVFHILERIKGTVSEFVTESAFKVTVRISIALVTHHHLVVIVTLDDQASPIITTVGARYLNECPNVKRRI
jgi:hypothetical protein